MAYQQFQMFHDNCFNNNNLSVTKMGWTQVCNGWFWVKFNNNHD